MLGAICCFLLFSDPPAKTGLPETPTGTAQPLHQLPVEVKVAPSAAAKLRQGYAAEPRCVQVPKRLFHKPPDSWAKVISSQARLAANHKTLAILIPEEARSFRLLLIQRGRIQSEYFLRLPPGEELPVGRFAVSEDDSYVLLFTRETILVYGQGTYLATIRAHSAEATVVKGELHFFPIPETPYQSLKHALKTGEELPALWVRSELDGSNQETLLRVNPKRLDPEYPAANEWAMAVAPRADGKLWLVGIWSAEVLLATPSGSILRSTVLPFRFPTEADDPEKTQRKVEEAKKLAEAKLAEAGLLDATRRPARGVLWVGLGRRLFWNAFARGNDLVVTTTDMTKPPVAVLVYPADGAETRCLTFDEPTDVAAKIASRLAVTDEELWLAEPFGYYRWEELEELFSPREDKEGKGT
ncbi:MAG: hypothetical protein ACP5NF_11970, partial [Thermoanaerobaculum sp.]